jgi:dTDP-glucose 4,6-dehydratase
MRVLVTGSAGFIGHHVVDKILTDTDFDVVGLDRLSRSGNLNRISEIVKDFTRYTVIHHDIRSELNSQLLKQLGQFDYIFHIAASSHVDRSIDDPLGFVMDNVVGTCNVLNFARTQTNLKMFIYFSTDEVFGPAPPGVNYDEYSRYNSTNPYSATKAGGEELAVAFRNTYKLPIVVTHTMNVFGQRQHPEKFIPMCISKIKNNEVVTIHADSTCTRPGSRFYVHATDVAAALLFIIKLGDDVKNDDDMCPKFNIVGKEEVDNLSLAKYIADSMDKELKYKMVDFHSSRPGHDLRYALSGERLLKLGWYPTKSVKDRITEVVEWTLSHPFWV